MTGPSAPIHPEELKTLGGQASMPSLGPGHNYC